MFAVLDNVAARVVDCERRAKSLELDLLNYAFVTVLNIVNLETDVR
jgi:hypothetical protein